MIKSNVLLFFSFLFMSGQSICFGQNAEAPNNIPLENLVGEGEKINPIQYETLPFANRTFYTCDTQDFTKALNYEGITHKSSKVSLLFLSAQKTLNIITSNYEDENCQGEPWGYLVLQVNNINLNLLVFFSK